METVNKCPFCSSKEKKHFITAKDILYGNKGNFSYNKCQNCELVYLNPRPSEKEIGKYYPKTYEKHKIEQKKTFYRILVDIFLKLQLNLRIPFKKNGKFLEIGAGQGYLLENAEKIGWNVTGIEINKKAAEKISKKLGIKIFTKDLLECKFKKNSFDVVAIIHTLEHMHHPFKELKEIHKILKPGGMIWIEVPNIDSFEFKLFKKKWYALQPPVHLTHFNKKTISKTLNKAGFKIKKIRFDSTPWFFLRNFTDLDKHKWLYIITMPFIYPISLLLALTGKATAMKIYAEKK